MDRALKERIIGAIVLVLVAVLVVPVFLDGPSDDAAIVSETVTLPGQDPDARRQQTIVLERDRTEPVPVSTAQVAAEARDAAEKTAKTLTQQDDRAAADETGSGDSTEASPTGMWAVQLGSFSRQQNAERLAADLRGQGYAAFLSKIDHDSGALHRVRVGPQKDRQSAEAVAKRLGSEGHSGQVVPHP